MARGFRPPEPVEDKKAKELRALIEYKKILTGLSDEEIAIPIGMKPDTFRKKRCHPERFTYPEIIKLLTRLKATDEERLRVI